MPRAKRKKSAQANHLTSVHVPPREMELIGLTDDGRMVQWEASAMVQPITAFPRDGWMIESGHYVIQWKGHAITVHCENTSDGMVSVQFMSSRSGVLHLHPKEVEPMLLGRVIPDPEASAGIRQLFDEIEEALAARNRAPHLQRGRIS